MLAAPKINILARNIKTIALKRFIDAIRAPGAYHGVIIPHLGAETTAAEENWKQWLPPTKTISASGTSTRERNERSLSTFSDRACRQSVAGANGPFVLCRPTPTAPLVYPRSKAARRPQ
jgi:hypothetical protein